MNIETIITSLETAENDNRKFALLLILSDSIKNNKLDALKLDKTTTETEKTCRMLNERLFNSIGPHFLARLITTKQTTANSSPVLYKSVALSIITQFLDYPKLICDPILLSKIEIICDILLLDSENTLEDINRNLILDTFKYIFTLSNYCPDYLCQNAGLLELLIEKIILNKSYDKAARQNLSSLSSESLDDEKENLVSIACKLFVHLCNDESFRAVASSAAADETEAKKYLDYKNEKVVKCLKLVLSAAENDQSEFKFNIINYLNFFLESPIIQNFVHGIELTDLAGDCLFNILNNLFRAKINRTYKELGFILLNNFVRLYQFEFIYMKNRSFFYLIIHLLCIEIGFNLQDSDDLNVKLDASKVVFTKLSDKMSIFYSLMEEVIIILSTASPFDSQDVDSEDEAVTEKDEEPELKKVIKVIVETLELIITFVKDSLYEKSVSAMTDNDIILLIASIRLLVCWLAHESLLEQELMDLMPELITFGQYLNKKKKNADSVNIFEFLVPGIQRVLIDQEDRLTARNESVKKVDMVKSEFIDTELREKINESKELLNKCESYLE